jgi:hypothetical protein
VASQSSAACERLLAIGIWALVWALARVDAAMTRQRAGITEGLSTSLTHMRLLASVDTLVDRQGGTLDELLAAVGVIANMRADAAVDTFMTCEVTASREAFTTCRARESLWWTRVGCGPPAIVLVLDLVVWHLLLLGIGVFWGGRDVVAVV